MFITGTFAHARNTSTFAFPFPGEPPKHTFKKYASDQHQTKKYGMCNFLGLRNCASREHIKHVSGFRKNKNMLLMTRVLKMQ